MSSTRDFKSPGIFAEAASTAIPPTPIAGVAYRDAVSGADDVPNGWRYGTRVESQDWNQIMFLMTSMLGMIDSQGVLGWSDQVDYAVPALVFGSNGLPYIALQESGPSTAAQDPVSASAYWFQFASSGQIVLSTTQSWAVPLFMQLGYVKPRVTVIGGGAGGGHAESLSVGGGGGGGGGIGVDIIDLTGITSVSVTIGAAGAGAPSGASGPGSNGGNSSFGAYITANGGLAGSVPSGGENGAVTGASFVDRQSPASAGSNWATAGASGSGGGQGGAGASINTVPKGRNATGPGGGGAGGGGTAGTRGGGDGFAGQVIITW